jgi:DNA primase
MPMVSAICCWVSPKTNLFNCFACEILQKDLGLITDAPSKAPTKNTTTKLTPPLAANADSQTSLRQVIDYYHETFKQSPEVQEYLRSRGLEHPELS